MDCSRQYLFVSIAHCRVATIVPAISVTECVLFVMENMDPNSASVILEMLHSEEGEGGGG